MSTPTRNGKIARLPQALREELNQRLADGETGVALVEWLNGLPEVQTLIESQFGGHPILEQNLSQWKQGGYEDWRQDQKVMELAERLYERDQNMKQQTQGRPPLREVLSRWTEARYVVVTGEIEQTEGPESRRMLRQMCADVARLRRLEQNDRRLEIEQQRAEIEREQLKLERERFAAEREEKRWKRHPAASRKGSAAGSRRYSGSESDADSEEANDPTEGRRWEDCSDEERIAWARIPENLERINAQTKEQKIARLREIFGPRPTRAAAPIVQPQATAENTPA